MTADPAPAQGRPPGPGRRPALAALAGAACISCSAILITLAGTGAATTTFYRCLLALPALAVLAGLERRRRGPRPVRARAGAFVAGLFLAVDLVLWNHAIAAVGAGIATVLGNLQVLLVALAAWLLLGERPGGRFLAALPVVLGGVVLVSGLADGGTVGRHALAGIGFGAGTSVAYACFLLILRQSSAGAAQSSAGAAQSSAGAAYVAGPLTDATAGAAAGAVVLGLLFGGFALHLAWASLGWLLALALGSQTVGWLLITASLPRLPAAVSSLLLLLQPAAAVLAAAVVLGEQPTGRQLAGAALVCGGVLAACGQLPWLRRRGGPQAAPVRAALGGQPAATTSPAGPGRVRDAGELS